MKKKIINRCAAKYDLSLKILESVWRWSSSDSVEDVARVLRHGSFAKETTTHKRDVSKDDLFGSIDKAIVTLNELKNKGYEEISEMRSGYETNYFVATKIEYETDDEYYKRIAEEIDEIIELEKEKKSERRKREKRIAELEAELKKLKNQK